MPDETAATSKRRITILGAGPAGLTAAVALTDTPELRAKHHVTIYQMGWRAGGKCRTGRVPPQDWVDQNGTHYLFGCYANALATVRHVYEELNALGDMSYGTFEENVSPVNFLLFKQPWRGRVVDWPLLMPSNRVRPGSPGVWLPILDYLEMTVKRLFAAVFGWRALNAVQWPGATPPGGERGGFGRFLDRIRAVVQVVVQWVGMALIHFAIWLGNLLFGHRGALRATAWWMWFWRGFWRIVLRPFKGWMLWAARLWILVDQVTTTVIGVAADRVDERGVESIDCYDYREWLSKHGASSELVDSSVVLNWYNAVGSYEEGDRSRPRIAAGVSIRALARATLAYKGAFAYSLTQEVGESVIAPMYRLLRHRGVEFVFFHRVWDLVPSADGTLIEAVAVERQVDLVSGDPAGYDPLVPIERPGGPPLMAWPNTPKWDLIATTEAEGSDLESFYSDWDGVERFRLEHGRDYDDLVFAMPVGVVPYHAQRLVEAHTSWRRMWEHVRGAETQSLRLWLKPDLAGLGWPYPLPITSLPTWPLTTWEDNSSLISGQHWPEGPPGSIASLFGTIPAPEFPPGPTDRQYPVDQDDVAAADAAVFLSTAVGMLWPAATSANNPEGIDESLVMQETTRSNNGPLDRYTMALPGATRHRLAPDESSYRNLFLVGDWTRNGSIIGDVDGSVMSGLMASRRMCGHPRSIIGDPGF